MKENILGLFFFLSFDFDYNRMRFPNLNCSMSFHFQMTRMHLSNHNLLIRHHWLTTISFFFLLSFLLFLNWICSATKYFGHWKHSIISCCTWKSKYQYDMPCRWIPSTKNHLAKVKMKKKVKGTMKKYFFFYFYSISISIDSPLFHSFPLSFIMTWNLL